MVRDWFRQILYPPEVCGPMCKAVQDEVRSIGRAEALARQSKKERNRQRGARGQ